MITVDAGVPVPALDGSAADTGRESMLPKDARPAAHPIATNNITLRIDLKPPNGQLSIPVLYPLLTPLTSPTMTILWLRTAFYAALNV